MLPDMRCKLESNLEERTARENSCLAKASLTSSLLSLPQPRTITLLNFFNDALDPHWTPERGVWNPSKGHHLYDATTLSIREKIKSQQIQIFDNKWIDITLTYVQG